MRMNSMLPRFIPVLLIFMLLSCGSKNEPTQYRDLDFNSGWVFHMGDVSGAMDPGFNDVDWQPVHLPHDWSIMDYESQDSLHVGPFYKNTPKGEDIGYQRIGCGWYRKEFLTPEGIGKQQVILDFDGVQSQMELWVNGQLIGEHVYGYTPFHFNISSALKAAGESNLIAVKTVNTGENSRWFAGAGIYREVKLSVLNPVSVTPWGLSITTPEVSADRASVQVEISLMNHSSNESLVTCTVSLVSPSGESYELEPVPLVLPAGAKETVVVPGGIETPSLWKPEDPKLYRAVVRVQEQGKEIDFFESTFGIRSIVYSATTGFLLNGEEVLLKGACMHHDNGLLGAAAFPDAEYRRVKIMKENGYNAIRTSHNPPSGVFLDACDEIGMLVIDEAFDQWVKPKRPNDYSNYFKDWHIRDVQAMVYRDRNHPCVVMWSFGNEIQERSDPEGVEIGKTLVKAIKEIDETRPLTQAVCDFWDNPGKEWDYTEGAFSIQDIGGYNYQFLKYEPDHQLFPERMMYGSESVPQHAWENWEMVKRHPFVFGDFVWTGMDYIGESGIGHHYLAETGSEETWQGLPPWPWYVAWCGDIDILGNKKAQSSYRDVVWEESKLEMLVSTPVPEGKESRLSYWGWYDELEHWNWEGHEGRMMHVKVYSSYPEVKLELNGTLVGVSEIDSLDQYVARFEVPYEPGELKATGIKEGMEMEAVLIQTAGPAAQLVVEEEGSMIRADKNSLAYLNVSLLDKEGIPVLTNDVELQVNVSGAAILQAAGNASPKLQGSFTDATFRLFRGKGLVIVRSTGEPGTIMVELSADDLDPVRTTLEASNSVNQVF